MLDSGCWTALHLTGRKCMDHKWTDVGTINNNNKTVEIVNVMAVADGEGVLHDAHIQLAAHTHTRTCQTHLRIK